MIRNAVRAVTVLLAALAVPATIVAGSLPASAAGGHASGPHARAQLLAAYYSQLCEHDSPNLCWRDPSDGGPGTGVVNSGWGTDNARLWNMFTDSSRCGGHVSNANACPFTPGGGLNSKYNGDRIVYVQNYGSSYCAGSSLSDYAFVYMHSCDSVNGVNELATVFVEEQFSTHFRLVSVVWSDRCEGSLCNIPYYITGTNTNDAGLSLTVNPGTYARWTGAGF